MYKFKAYGHKNITAKHKTTLEFTKDKDLSLKGDCIIGVRADFKLNEIKQFFKNLKGNKIKVIIKVDGLKEEINATINSDFDDEEEIVIRKTDYISERTLGINADKATYNLGNRFISKLKNPMKEIIVEIISF